MSGDVMGTVTLQPIVDALETAVSAQDIVDLVATGIAIGVPFLITWFAVRYIWRKFTSAVKGGRG